MRRRMIMRPMRDAAVAGTALLAAVLLGSRGGRDLDPALFGYLSATFIAVVAGSARVSAFWRRPASAFYGREILTALRNPARLRTAMSSVTTDLAAQRPIARRSRGRWLAHMGLSLGTLASFAITLPLVMGWLSFAADGQHAYVPLLAGWPVASFALDGVLAWLVFHGLSLAGLAVMGGAAYFLATRILGSARSGTTWRDVAPLFLLLAVAISGLALPASRQHPTAFDFASRLHELFVIVLLVSLPFSKLGHVFLRPLQIGVRLVRAEEQPRSACARCGIALAPSAQVAAVEAMLAARGRSTSGHRRHCPSCKRALLADAQSACSPFARAADRPRASLALHAEDA